MNMFKGMSINVMLSDEQMEHISNLTADKVNQTRTHYMNETEVLQQEVQDLRREIKRRDDIVIKDLLGNNNYKLLYNRLKLINRELREEIQNLKGNDQNSDSVNPWYIRVYNTQNPNQISLLIELIIIK